MTKSERKRATTFMVTQQLDPQYWDWSSDEKKAFDQGKDAVFSVLGTRIRNAIANDDPEDFGFCGILHDSDTSFEYDPKTRSKVIVPKAPHIHVVLMFNKRRDLDKVARWAGVESQYVEVPHRGKYGRENMLAYLVHAKDGSKHAYSPEQVATFKTFDYMSYYYQHADAWNYQRASRSKKQNNVKADWLAKQVQTGHLSKDQILLTDDYAEVYADNMRLINDAFQFYGEKKGYETLQALKNHEFEMSVIFITGKPRMGKTVFAQGLINKLIDREFKETGNKWRAYAAADTNPMDDYAGEEIVFMDDLRSSAMTASAWLKLLDPVNVSPTGARYHNKMVAPRVIILTSYMDPFTFFGFMKGTAGTNEALEQFIGRLSMIAKVIDLNDLHKGQVQLDHRGISVNDIVRTDEPVKYKIGEERIKGEPEDLPAKPIWRKSNFADIERYVAPFDDAQSKMINQIIELNDPKVKHIPRAKKVVPAVDTNADSVKKQRDQDIAIGKAFFNAIDNNPDNPFAN